jgi:hypothetical protein
VFGTDNETVLKRAAGPQIMPIYGTDFRSIPTFFIQDDHDYFDNDEATDDIVTFPPPYFSLQLGRATRSMYYPEFLLDAARPLGLPWTSVDDRSGLSECFGTVRYGRLAEILLYDIRRTQTLAGESAVYVDLEAEKGLKHSRFVTAGCANGTLTSSPRAGSTRRARGRDRTTDASRCCARGASPLSHEAGAPRRFHFDATSVTVTTHSRS